MTGFIFNVYSPPSLSISEYETLLTEGKRPVIIMSNFNAWMIEWDSRDTTQRDELLLKAFDMLDVLVVNTGYPNF